MAAVGPAAVPPPPPPPRERAEIDGDKIVFAGKRFHVKIGNQVETSPGLLLLVQRFLNEGGALQNLAQVIQKGAPLPAAKTSPAPLRCPIDLQTGKITVVRGSGTVGEVVAKGEGAASLRTQIEQRSHFVHELKKGLQEYTPETIREAVSLIRNEGHIRLGDPNYSDEWQEKTLGDKLHMQGNEGLFAALNELGGIQKTTGQKKGVESCRKGIVLFILQNMQKNPLLTKQDTSTAIQRVYQDKIEDIDAVLKSGKVLSKELFEANRAYPSESDRRSAQAKYGDLVGAQSKHPSNLRVVDVHDRDGNVIHKVFGSGRADNPDRLKRLVLFTAMQQADVPNNPVFVDRGDGVLEFRHLISSYKDFSRLKKMFVEDERSLIENLLKAAADWPKEGYTVKMMVNGEARDVVLKKPIIANQPFSQFARYSTLGQEHSDRCNFISNQQLFAETIEEAPDALKECATALDKKLQEVLPGKGSFIDEESGLINWDKVPYDLLLGKVKWYTIGDGDFFGSKEMQAYLKEMDTLLQGEIAAGSESATCLYALMFRRLPDAKTPFHWRPEAHESLHAMDLEIYRTNLCTALNLSRGMQCKSGSDRTAIGTALASSLARFKEMTGRTFMPEKATEDELMQFKGLFRAALIHHGSAYAVQTKGYSGLKMAWGKDVGENPVPLKYLYLEGDKGVRDPDVIGLSAENLRARGSEQYKGTLATRALLYGKSETAGMAKKGIVHTYSADRVRAAQKEIRGADVKAVNAALATIFARFGIKLAPKEYFVNAKLEPAIYAGKLALERNGEVLKAIRAMLDKNDFGVELSGKQRDYLRYTLQTFYNLAQERALNQSLLMPSGAKGVVKLPVSAPLSAPAVGNGLLSLAEADEALPRPAALPKAGKPIERGRIIRQIDLVLAKIEKGEVNPAKPTAMTRAIPVEQLFPKIIERLGTSLHRTAILGFCRKWAEVNAENTDWNKALPHLMKIAAAYPDKAEVVGGGESLGLNYFLLTQAKNPGEFLENIKKRTALEALDKQCQDLYEAGKLAKVIYDRIQPAILERYSAL